MRMFSVNSVPERNRGLNPESERITRMLRIISDLDTIPTDRRRRPGRGKAKPCRASCFSLMELLIAIAVIVILVSMMLPAIAKSQKAARGISCIANLMQQGRLAQGYANDYLGHLPPHKFPIPGDMQYYWKTLALLNHIKIKNTYRFDGTIFACPEPSEGNRAFSPPYGCSYHCNTGILISFAGTPAAPIFERSGIKTHQIKLPSLTLLYYDSRGLYGLNSWGYTLPGTGNDNRVDYRHNALSANILFVDGHVKAYKPIPGRGIRGISYDSKTITE